MHLRRSKFTKLVLVMKMKWLGGPYVGKEKRRHIDCCRYILSHAGILYGILQGNKGVN